MMKLVISAIAMVSMVGCASKGDLNSLASRVSDVEAQNKAIVAEHERIKSDYVDLTTALNENNARLDRAFAKGKR